MPGPAKIYDRPERTGPSPILIVVVLLVLIVAGYFLYKALYHPAAASQRAEAGAIRVQTAFLREVTTNGEQYHYASYR
jgi:type II secretory pathway pseudopilin PulG